MSAAAGIPVENWGMVQVGTDSLRFHALPKGKGQAALATATDVSATPRFAVPFNAIAAVSGTTKTDVTLQLKPGVGASRAGAPELVSIRFAVPETCVGFEQTEQAGKEIIQRLQQRVHGSGGADAADLIRQATQSATDNGRQVEFVRQRTASGSAKDVKEVTMAVFEDIPLSYPSGKYTITLSNFSATFKDTRKQGSTFTVPLWDILQLYVCDIPNAFDKGVSSEKDDEVAQYIMIILKQPVQVRATTYAHIVLSCPAGVSISPEFPWKCELSTQEEINAALGIPKSPEAKKEEDADDKTAEESKSGVELTPTMHGRMCDILVSAFRATASLQKRSDNSNSNVVLGVSAVRAFNSNYHTVLAGPGFSVMRCLHKGSEGLLYVCKSALLFLHRPASRVLFSDIDHAEVDESSSGNATFQLVVYAKKSGPSAGAGGSGGQEKLVFSSIDKVEKAGLISYLDSRVSVVRKGIDMDDEGDDDEESDEEDGDEEDGESSEGDDEDDESDLDFDDSDDEDSDDDGGERKAKKSSKVEGGEKREKKEKKHKKDKKDKKHKKDKSDKKEKKHKKDKKDKKDKKHKRDE